MQGGVSCRCSRGAGLCFWHSPTLRLCQGRAPAGSCICMQPCQHSTDSLFVDEHFGHQALLTSCALALLGNWCIARRSACGFSGVLCQGKSLARHSAHDPTAECQHPLCQKGVLALCKGWLLSLLGSCHFATVRTASLFLTDPVTRCCTPFAATHITEPSNQLSALCHHTVRCAIIHLITPLRCHQRSLGSQGVVPAHLAAFALRATIVIAPAVHSRQPAVQVPIWTLVASPPDLPVTMCGQSYSGEHWQHNPTAVAEPDQGGRHRGLPALQDVLGYKRKMSSYGDYLQYMSSHGSKRRCDS
ncbi:hypothetical protein ABBQ32_002603 [Trebouxia sp. C0010 RCD-2024]